MGDAVKKSRIVSEDEKDLEEALLEEFNIRLKNCMSNDDLQKEGDPPEPDDIYENLQSPKISPVRDTEASKVFLQKEIQETLYDKPKSMLNNGHGQNGHHEEDLYEKIQEKTETLDQNYVPMVDCKEKYFATLDLSPKHSKSQEYEVMGQDDEISNLYESVELKNSKPAITLPTTSLTDYSEQDSLDLEQKSSVKDRMFLSCDDTSTLLFTQTVTSPMLTPSEENIDFLKGFQRDNTNSDSTVSNSPPKEHLEEKIKASETSPDVSDPLEDAKEENFYENTEYYKNTTPENTYENITVRMRDIEGEENIYEHVEDVKSEVDGEEDVQEEEEDIYQNIEEVLGSDRVVILDKNGRKSQDTDDGSLEEFIRNEKEVSEGYLMPEPEAVDNTEDVGVEQGLDAGEIDLNRSRGDLEGVHMESDNQEAQVVEKNSGDAETDVHLLGESVEGLVNWDQDIQDTVHNHQEPEELVEDPQEAVDLVQNELEPVDLVQNDIKIVDAEPTRENVCNKEKIASETYKELIYHHKSESNSNYYEKYTDVVSKTSKNEITNREKDTETVPAEIVKNLKSQFQSKTGAEVVGGVKKEGNGGAEFKSANSINQIKTKFEVKEGGDGRKVEVDDSTEYSETIVETNAPGERIIKKKKVKKTRKEEKENISVTENGHIEGENFYNVNVKNLCRSFGDLTKIKKDRNKRESERGRTKSLTDVLSPSNHKNIENVFSGVSVKSLKEKFNSVEGTNKDAFKTCPFKSEQLKSSFSKFDALQKKNVLHVRSSDSTKAQEKFSNGQSAQIDITSCRACGKTVFQMEQVKAEKSIWHRNCFRCIECNKQLTVDIYESNEGNLYCKPHFKALFAPKAVEEDAPQRTRKPEPIIRENQPVELPPGVVRASDKPDLGLEELQSLNVKERFQVFEHYQTQTEMSSVDTERGGASVKRSPSILSKLARFQKHGMDVGVSNEALDGVPIEETSSEEEIEEEVPEDEDPDLVRAKKVQKEKPFHFTGMSDVKNRWEHGDHAREERREETKQEIQNIRNRLFLGKQEKMKEAYKQAIMESESSSNLRKSLGEQIEVCDTKSIKERFEKGEVANDKSNREKNEEEEVYESEISKNSRSLFLELDASASKPPQVSPVTPPKLEVKKAREAYLAKTSSEDIVKSTEQVEDIEVKTADIQQRFKFFETYREPEKEKKQFRITPPRDPSQVKTETPEREIYRDPDVIRAEEFIDDSVIAKETHTASKMLNKFRLMEENLTKEPEPAGLKPLKRFTPPPEPTRPETNSEEEESSEYEEEEDEADQAGKLPDDVIEAQKAARAKQLRAKFEKWEANEIKKEQQNSVNIVEEFADSEQSQIESTRVIRARFESMKQSSSDSSKASRVKPNRFVDMSSITETCQGCNGKVYPLEKISIHGNIYHKNCFRCMECSCVLRMDSYSYNQGLLYCTPHFKRLFISKGNYDSAFGLDQHKEKWSNNVNMSVA